MSDKDFQWGSLNSNFINIISEEIFTNRIYEKYYKIKDGDIVVDIGANCGAFPYSFRDVKVNSIFCLEPSNELFEVLKHNLNELPCTFINKGISNVDCENKEISKTDYIYSHNNSYYSSIKFSTLIKENNIKKIDFLKFDCEGGELFIFNKENCDFITKHVKNIAGEYHITNIPNSLEHFKEFRDLYLKQIKDTGTLHVFERGGRDVTNEIFDDNYLNSFNEWWQTNAPDHGQFIIFANFESLNEKNISPIPVIGTMVVNSTHWVTRLLMSIDYPVDTFYIINNSSKDELTDELNNLTKINHKFVKNIKVSHMAANLGVSCSWNLIIKSFIMQPYWIIVNDDVAFTPGFLKEMVDAAEQDVEVGIVHGHSGDYSIGSWDLFLIKDHVIRKLGLFDENLYPAYCEDSDYIMRVINAKIKRVMSLTHDYYHGFGKKNEYYLHGSQTQKTDETLKEKLDNSNNLNIEYLTEKWGLGWRLCNPNMLPFIQKPIPLTYTSFDIDFVRKKHMGF